LILPAVPSREFWDLIDHHRQLVVDDNDGEDHIGLNTGTAFQKTPLAELFNFTSDEWANRYDQYTRIGYDEEMELYDLLEMDAEGEAEDLDDFTRDILMN
jgi:hypothetical protein